MIDPEVMEEFLTESAEHLASVEEDILALERGEADSDTVNHLFRALHTVKGAASFLSLRRVTALAHSLEDVVGRFRAGVLVPSEEIVDVLLRGIDLLKLVLENPDDETIPIEDDINALREIAENRTIPAERDDSDKPKPPREDREPADFEVASDDHKEEARSPSDSHKLEPERSDENRRDSTSSRSSKNRVEVEPEQEQQEQGTSPERVIADVKTSAETQKDRGGEHTVRISLSLLDNLMNLASELVLVRNQNMQAINAGNTEQLIAIAQQLNVVTSELQSSIMQTRMRPVKPVFSRFTRIVRDLAKKLGKEVDLVIVGADVELDKNIIEAIGDPLTHLIRNAVDHGIEPPDVRRGKEKQRSGKIVLSAFHRAGQVVIQIKDDGYGMNPEALKNKAISKGLLTEEQAASMPARDAFNLIFAPGFSMARQITDVSGRGVGMDAVQAAFKKLGGVVDVTSRIDEGTTITIKLPLTLAIVPALIVSVEGLRFAIPQVNIDEVVLLYGDRLYQDLKVVDEHEVYWLRGKLLPILRLSKILNISKSYQSGPGVEPVPERRREIPDRRHESQSIDSDLRQGPPERRRSAQNSANIVVLKLGNEQFGLLVDTIIDTEEIVVKSLHDQLKSCGAYAGTTVLGDGRIAMILDVAALVDLGGLRLTNMDRTITRLTSSMEARETVLLFDIGGRETFALPLRLVTRVEEIRADRIQYANGREYLAFRNMTMPLVRIEQVIPRFDSSYSTELLYVIIPRSRNYVGVLASSILDTVEIDCNIDAQTISDGGIFGSFLLKDQLTLLLDIFGVVEKVEPDLFKHESTEEGEIKRVLFVEDSAFYAALITPFLKSAGLEVTHVVNGVEGLKKLSEKSFDLIVSDIEMPIMDGYEFASKVRRNNSFRDVPMLAISAVNDESMEAKALKSGFDMFQTKLDHGRLIQSIFMVSDELRGR